MVIEIIFKISEVRINKQIIQARCFNKQIIGWGGYYSLLHCRFDQISASD